MLKIVVQGHYLHTILLNIHPIKHLQKIILSTTDNAFHILEKTWKRPGKRLEFSRSKFVGTLPQICQKLLVLPCAQTWLKLEGLLVLLLPKSNKSFLVLLSVCPNLSTTACVTIAMVALHHRFF